MIPTMAITIPRIAEKVIGIPTESRSLSNRNGDRHRFGIAIAITVGRLIGIARNAQDGTKFRG
jgi:hypothetical protein